VDGADFATLAKAESDDAGSGANGGDLGTFGHGRMVPAFEEVAFTIPVGELSEPVKSQFGYHIIKVESRQEKTFVEVRAEIEKKLDGEAVKKAMDDLKAATPVVMNPDYFGPAPAAMRPPAPAAVRSSRNRPLQDHSWSFLHFLTSRTADATAGQSSSARGRASMLGAWAVTPNTCICRSFQELLRLALILRREERVQPAQTRIGRPTRIISPAVHRSATYAGPYP
jgi:hypothetical protein